MSAPHVVQMEGAGETLANSLSGIAKTLETVHGIRQRDEELAQQALLRQAQMSNEAAQAQHTQMETQLVQTQMAHLADVARQTQAETQATQALTSYRQLQQQDLQQKMATARENAANFQTALAGLRTRLTPGAYQNLTTAVAMHDAGLPDGVVSSVLGMPSAADLRSLRAKYPQLAGLPDADVVPTASKMILRAQSAALTSRGAPPSRGNFRAEWIPKLQKETADPATGQPTLTLAQARMQADSLYDVAYAPVANGIAQHRQPLTTAGLESIARSIAPVLSRVSLNTPGGLLRALNAAGRAAIGRDLTQAEQRSILFRARALNVKPTPAAR